MPLQGRQGAAYGGSYFPGDHGPTSGRAPDPIQEFRLGLENEIVRMRPNPQRENGLVIRMRGDERIGDPELMDIVALRALYKSLVEEGYAKM